MALIKSIKNVYPKIGEDCWLADNACIIGDVEMGEGCSIWFHAVVRGDVNPIRLGMRTNIQDGAVIHCTYQKTTTHLGNYVSVGHNAIVHGCRVEDYALIGMGAIVMDEAIVESEALIAAGAVVLEKTRVQAGYLYAGVPAKKIKKIDDEQRALFARTANNYLRYAGWLKEPKNRQSNVDR